MDQNFIWIIGPQAVGKMAVGRQLAHSLGYQFSHNHHSIEFALQFHTYGTDGFRHLNNGIRSLIFENVRKFPQKGLIFTYMMDFEDPREFEYIKNVSTPYLNDGWKVLIVELEADIQTRLSRNSHPDRLKAKPSKQDVELSNERLERSHEKYILNSSIDHPFPLKSLQIENVQYLKINNSNVSIDDQTKRICEYFELKVS